MESELALSCSPNEPTRSRHQKYDTTFTLHIVDGKIIIWTNTGSHKLIDLCQALLDNNDFREAMPQAENYNNEDVEGDRAIMLEILLAYRKDDLARMEMLIDTNSFPSHNHEALRILFSLCYRRNAVKNGIVIHLERKHNIIPYPASISTKQKKKEQPQEAKMVDTQAGVKPQEQRVKESACSVFGNRKTIWHKMQKKGATPGLDTQLRAENGLRPAIPRPVTVVRGAKKTVAPWLVRSMVTNKVYSLNKGVVRHVVSTTQKSPSCITNVKSPKEAEKPSTTIRDEPEAAHLEHEKSPTDNRKIEMTNDRESQNNVRLDADIVEPTVDDSSLINDIPMEASTGYDGGSGTMRSDEVDNVPENEKRMSTTVETESETRQDDNELSPNVLPSRTRRRTQPYESQNWKKPKASANSNPSGRKRGRSRKSIIEEKEQENEPPTPENVAPSNDTDRVLEQVAKRQRQSQPVTAEMEHDDVEQNVMGEPAMEIIGERFEPFYERNMAGEENNGASGIPQVAVDNVHGFLPYFEMPFAPYCGMPLENYFPLPLEEGPSISNNQNVVQFAPVKREVVEEVVHPYVEAPNIEIPREIKQEEIALFERAERALQPAIEPAMEPALESALEPLLEAKEEVDEDIQIVRVVERHQIPLEPVVEQALAPIIPDPSIPPRCGENFKLWSRDEMVAWILAVSKSEETAQICKKEEVDGASMKEFLCEKTKKELNIQYFPWKKLKKAAQQMIENLPR